MLSPYSQLIHHRRKPKYPSTLPNFLLSKVQMQVQVIHSRHHLLLCLDHKCDLKLSVHTVYKRQFNICSKCVQPIITTTGHSKHHSYAYWTSTNCKHTQTLCLTNSIYWNLSRSDTFRYYDSCLNSPMVYYPRFMEYIHTYVQHKNSTRSALGISFAWVCVCVCSFLTAHQHKKAIKCHSRFYMMDRIWRYNL